MKQKLQRRDSNNATKARAHCDNQIITSVQNVPVIGVGNQKSPTPANSGSNYHFASLIEGDSSAQRNPLSEGAISLTLDTACRLGKHSSFADGTGHMLQSTHTRLATPPSPNLTRTPLPVVNDPISEDGTVCTDTPSFSDKDIYPSEQCPSGIAPNLASERLNRPGLVNEVATVATASIAPVGLLESAKFPEDIIYYHHLRDISPTGLLSILGLSDIFKAEYLDRGFFNAVLALAALNVSQSNVSKALAESAALHALDHFVTALGIVRIADIDGDTSGDSDSPATEFHCNSANTVSRLATILFLAYFELQRGQMKLWYVHSHAAVALLSQQVDKVRDSAVGESLIRSFSRLMTLLDIFDRNFSVRASLPISAVSDVLLDSLRVSPLASDRLLVILPRVTELEEEWRSDPQRELYWQEQAEGLMLELKGWRSSLPQSDVPLLDYDHFDQLPGTVDAEYFSTQSNHFPDSPNPVRAATNFMHYLVSLLRVQTRYSMAGKISPPNAEHTVALVCRLAAEVGFSSCASIHAYGHGMLPALMNAYYMSQNESARNWIRSWLAHFPRDREGIWNVRHALRLLKYIDEEYSKRGPRSGWTVIKVRMVDLDEESTSNEDDTETDPDRFSVEIYARSKRGWSIDFVEIP